MIKDSVYLVTGGASGLGKGVSEKLLAEGANVVIIDLQSPPENDKLRSYGDRVLLLQVDITSEKEIGNALDVIKRKFEKLNGVINCADICQYQPLYDFEKREPHSLQEFTTIITVNLIGTFNVIRLAIPLLIENKPDENGERGIIITTSSVAGHQGRPNLLAYSASKAGVIGMTYPLAKELNGHGIRVVDLAPGSYDSPMYQDIMTQHKKGQFVSLKFLGQPSDFGDFVKSVINTPILNGTSVKLDGGLKS